MKHKLIIYSLLACFIGLTGCHQQTKPDIDSNTSIHKPRIVVINSDATELLLAIKAGGLIVGKDDSDSKTGIFQPLENIPRVGKWSNPNIESIVALHPDVVITYDRWPDTKELDDKLAPFGITVIRVAGYRIETMVSDIKKLGEVTGNVKEAAELINFIEYYFSLIRKRCGEITEKKTVYFEFSMGSALGKGSGGDQLLQLISAENIAAEFEAEYPKISPEWLLVKDPDLILITLKSGEIAPEMYDNAVIRQGWKNLSAVKGKRIYFISNEISSSPRGIIGALYIAKWAYPEMFTDIDPGEIHAEWLKKFYNTRTDKLYVYP